MLNFKTSRLLRKKEKQAILIAVISLLIVTVIILLLSSFFGNTDEVKISSAGTVKASLNHMIEEKKEGNARESLDEFVEALRDLDSEKVYNKTHTRFSFEGDAQYKNLLKKCYTDIRYEIKDEAPDGISVEFIYPSIKEGLKYAVNKEELVQSTESVVEYYDKNKFVLNTIQAEIKMADGVIVMTPELYEVMSLGSVLY